MAPEPSLWSLRNDKLLIGLHSNELVLLFIFGLEWLERLLKQQVDLSEIVISLSQLNGLLNKVVSKNELRIHTHVH